MSSLAGQTLGRYRLQSSLGRGGMAEVYRAFDDRLGRTVAVKVILPSFTSQPEFLERFLREARLVAALEHPNILPVYDFGEQEGLPFLVMPYLDGGTLSDRMTGGPVPLAQVVPWIEQLAEALDAAHRLGVLHRDVKPANVLFGKDERVILADFGIAKMREATTRLTTTGMVVGTPLYMAPELAQGQQATAASDRYALGVIAYELLAGRPPFEGENALALLHQHVTRPVPSLTEQVRDLPADLDEVFEQALAKEPGRRPVTSRALAASLATYLGEDRWSSGAVTARPPAVTVPLAAEAGSEPVRAPSTLPASAPASTLERTASVTQPVAPTAAPASAARLQAAVRRRPGLWLGGALLILVGVASVVGLSGLRDGERPAGEEPAVSPTSEPPLELASPIGQTVESSEESETGPAGQRSELPEPTRSAADDGLEERGADEERPAPGTAPPEVRAEPPGLSRAPLERSPALIKIQRALAARWREGGRLGRQEFQALLATARRGLELEPGDRRLEAVAVFAQGGLAYLDGDRATAEASLSRLVREDQAFELWSTPLLALRRIEGPAAGLADWQLALAYGDPLGEAQAQIDSELRRHPDDLAALSGRAVVRHLDGEHGEAASQATAIDRRFASLPAAARTQLHLFIADEHSHQGEWGAAVTGYQRTLALGGDSVNRILMKRARMLALESQGREAALQILKLACSDGGSEPGCRETERWIQSRQDTGQESRSTSAGRLPKPPRRQPPG